jgi:hypothetical protein
MEMIPQNKIHVNFRGRSLYVWKRKWEEMILVRVAAAKSIKTVTVDLNHKF